MLICWAVLGGFVLDAIFGDPAWLPHPVVLMGKAITALEKRLRAQFPQTPQGELCGGAVLAAILPVGTFLITALVCRLGSGAAPAGGACRADVLVRPGVGRQGPCAGKLQCV